MALRALVSSACVAALIAACAGSTQARAPAWPQVAAGLRPGLEPRSANPCQRGDVGCLKLVLAEMRRRDRKLSASCDHRALFTRMYLRTTEALLSAARAGRFSNRAEIVHFAAWFARYHFRAEDAWDAGRRAAVPAAWRAAFRVASGRSVRGIGDVLLGMNAHISRDLALTVADLERGPGRTVDPDFALFTQVIESKSTEVLQELAARFDPAIALAEVPLVLGGPRSLGTLIGVWRTEAWRNGIAFRDARGAGRAAVARRIESVASLRADAIVASTAYLPGLQSSRARDAFCSAHAGR
jgi:hypothetical protein